METEKLVILEFEVQEVTIHVYTINSDTNVDEGYIKKLGFNPDYCQWSFGTGVTINIHNEIPSSDG